MLHSIRWRIAIPYLLLILFTMVGTGFYLSGYLRETYVAQIESNLTSEARLAAANLNAPLISQDDPEALDRLAKDWSSLLDARVTIIRDDGIVLGESHEDRFQMENHLNRPEVQGAIHNGRGSITRFSSTTGYQMIYTAIPVYEDDKVIAVVRLALPLQQVQTNIEHIQRTLISSTVIAAVLAVVFAILIAERTTRPIRNLTEAASEISRGNLQERILPATADEVGKLTQAFNRMSVQLRTQIDALESERSKMAAVLAEMTDGVIIADTEGQIRLINPAAEAMFAINRQSSLGHSLAEVLRNHQMFELWQRCRETGRTQVASLEIPSRRLYLQCVATPLEEPLPDSILLLFQNLTRIRQLETVRRDFISNISHELRTPLASLKALTETLQEGALDDPPAAHRFLQHMETEVDSLSLMVSELLELSRIESGRVPLKLGPIAPRELISQAVDRLRLQAVRSGLVLNFECPEDIPLTLADPTRLEQVLVNLLHNAIKFTPRGGEILVGAHHKNDTIEFFVKDTGAGIPPEDLPRIFERFFKSDWARSSGGTGLGLAIARHMIEAHGGRIWAESQEGFGSTFFFTIPIA